MGSEIPRDEEGKPGIYLDTELCQNQAREKQAKQAIMIRWNPEPPALDPWRLAFSVIVDGLEPDTTFRAMLWNDLRIESYAKVYGEMSKVCSEMICMASESMEKARFSVPTPCLVSFHGCWQHRRTAMRCLFSVIYPKTGQVVNSIVVSNKKGWHARYFIPASFCLTSRSINSDFWCLRSR